MTRSRNLKVDFNQFFILRAIGKGDVYESCHCMTHCPQSPKANINIITVTSPIFRTLSFLSAFERGPIDGAIAISYRTWFQGPQVRAFFSSSKFIRKIYFNRGSYQ